MEGDEAVPDDTEESLPPRGAPCAIPVEGQGAVYDSCPSRPLSCTKTVRFRTRRGTIRPPDENLGFPGLRRFALWSFANRIARKKLQIDKCETLKSCNVLPKMGLKSCMQGEGAHMLRRKMLEVLRT